jgi:transcriptional regulator with XRE-family HTH domain
MWLIRQLAAELRQARLAAGLSQASVAEAAGTSQQSVSRIELGLPPFPDLVLASRVARIVGLELRLRCFPAAGQLRDIAHIALIRRFLARVSAGIRRQLEVPVAPGDLRAWDAVLEIGGVTIGVIAETRIRDLQALLRREHRKQVDGGIDYLLLLISDTRLNRTAIHEAGDALATAFPLGTRAVMAQLGRGKPIRANGIVIL